MALPQKDEGVRFSCAGPPRLTVKLRDLETVYRHETMTELLRHYVTSPNPRIPVVELCPKTWETGLRQVTCIVLERHLRLCGHVTGLYKCSCPSDPVLSGSGVWTMQMGRPRASCLRRMASYLDDMSMTDPAAPWAMARQRLKDVCWRVDATMRCSDVYPPVTDPI